MKPHLLLITLVALLVTSCHAPNPKILQPTTRLNAGQSKTEVIAIMGAPLITTSPGHGVEILKYQFKQPRGPLKTTLRTEYHVRLVDGKVEAYGTPRDLLSQRDPRERTLNLNIKTASDGQTNTSVAPVQPQMNIKAD